MRRRRLAMVLAFTAAASAWSRCATSRRRPRRPDCPLSISTAGERFGLRGRGVKVDLDGCECSTRATILHWEFSTSWCWRGWRRTDGVEIVDPASGRRGAHGGVPSAFTGVALVFEPNDLFRRAHRRRWARWPAMKAGARVGAARGSW